MGNRPVGREPRDVAPFDLLVETVRACQLCPRMQGRTRVLGASNGRVTARIVFVAEAPGRHGADRLGVPLAGDRTGQVFNALLDAAGLSREDVFLTNAVLCNPRNELGNNDRPTAQEAANCRKHLESLLAILRPDWVISLGTVALSALDAIEPHSLRLRHDVGRAVRWRYGKLVPLYHPSPRALIHRPLAAQRADYRRLGNRIRRSARKVLADPAA
jgi:uracil-DNA glycosylase